MNEIWGSMAVSIQIVGFWSVMPLLFWRWRHCVPLKCWYPIYLHDVSSHKTVTFINTACVLWDLRFSKCWILTLLLSGMWCCVAWLHIPGDHSLVLLTDTSYSTLLLVFKAGMIICMYRPLHVIVLEYSVFCLLPNEKKDASHLLLWA